MHAELSHDCPTSSVRGVWAGGYDRADGEWRRKGADAVRFGGRVLSVRELIEKAQSAPGVDWRALSSDGPLRHTARDRKSTRLNSSHVSISYAVFCLKKKKMSATTNKALEN